MARWLAGQRITADRLNLLTAKYARRSSDGTQPIAIGNSDNLMAFPTAVKTDPNVVASGAGNTGFTLQPGAWNVEASIRQSASTGGAIYICQGTPQANETEVITGQDATSIVRLASTTVFLDVATTIYIVVFNSGAATSASAQGKDLNHISFTRWPGF